MPPLIEVLPTTAASSGATWTYTTAPPPQLHTNSLPALLANPAAPISSSTSSKKHRPTRAAASGVPSSAVIDPVTGAPVAPTQANVANSASSRRDDKLQKHLLEFEKDNARDVVIAVPKQGQSGGMNLKSRTKPPTSTATTRKILSSLKSFANHLSDEEAALLAHAAHPPTHIAHLSASMRATRRDPLVPIPDSDSHENTDASNTRTPTSTPTPTPTPAPPGGGNAGGTQGNLLGNVTIMSGCSYGLPLAYAAARADPSIKPPRMFCEICGFWGRYRCLKCGARYCDLDCKGAHEETRCQRFWVQ
ncbi:hypothetical protein BDZ91DRAFT_708847 [Kalaharituber pfeilii]|nr:hypothetical protein BDZ91DRAFT_708847 [Kalaharituber pfeilii]